MGARTIYKCDRCGSETEKENDVRQVGVFVLDYYNRYGMKLQKEPTSYLTADWCLSCRDEMKLPRPHRPRDLPPAPGPTLEEVVREIVREEISDADRGR